MTFDPSIAEISKSKVVPKKKYARSGGTGYDDTVSPGGPLV